MQFNRQKSLTFYVTRHRYRTRHFFQIYIGKKKINTSELNYSMKRAVNIS